MHHTSRPKRGAGARGRPARRAGRRAPRQYCTAAACGTHRAAPRSVRGSRKRGCRAAAAGRVAAAAASDRRGRAPAPVARGRAALRHTAPRLPTRRGAQRSPLADKRSGRESGVRGRGCVRREYTERARGCVCVESASDAARRRAVAGRVAAPARGAARVACRRGRTIMSSSSGSLTAAAGAREAVMCPI